MEPFAWSEVPIQARSLSQYPPRRRESRFADLDRGLLELCFGVLKVSALRHCPDLEESRNTWPVAAIRGEKRILSHYSE